MRLYAILLLTTAIVQAAPAPVLVELFTSEGCSSCPPADRLLSRLEQKQPLPGVEIIALSEHVDYWNQLGWTDRFSSRGFTERQQQYVMVFQGEGTYTPQMVVDGATGFVGSDSRRALEVIAKAAQAPKTSVALRCAADPPGLGIHIDGDHDNADVVLAIAESGLASDVTRGENRGRQMEHEGVVRRLAVVGHAKKQQPFDGEPKIALDPTWRRENLSAVVFLQARSNHRVLGIARIALPACAAN
jgi:hypothetical protein